jgi:NADPH-dependent curcumin reductase CurA
VLVLLLLLLQVPAVHSNAQSKQHSSCHDAYQCCRLAAHNTVIRSITTTEPRCWQRLSRSTTLVYCYACITRICHYTYELRSVTRMTVTVYCRLTAVGVCVTGTATTAVVGATVAAGTTGTAVTTTGSSVVGACNATHKQRH